MLSYKPSAYGYKETPQAFIERHSGLVKKIAHHLLGRLPANVQLDDLIQSGMVGLLEAQQNYDASKGASFETFAGIRIRGAMLDELRRGDWAPRSVHKNNREINNALRILENSLGRNPTDSEIAQYLNMELSQYHQVLKDVDSTKLIGIDDLGLSEDTILTEQVTETDSVPLGEIIEGDFKSAMVEAIKTLPEREALVLSLYYDKELNLKEIGAVLDVSESRVSQILSQVTQRLRAKLSAWT